MSYNYLVKKSFNNRMWLVAELSKSTNDHIKWTELIDKVSPDDSLQMNPNILVRKKLPYIRIVDESSLLSMKTSNNRFMESCKELLETLYSIR